MKIFIRNSILFSVVLSLVLLCSCTRSNMSAEALLEDIMKKESELPDGIIYKNSAEEGSKDYLSPYTVRSLYGDGAYEYEFSLVEDYAIYLSSRAEPCEIAVIKCYSASDTDTVAKMFLERIEELKVLLNGTSFYTVAENAEVDIDGHFVIMIMT